MSEYMRVFIVPGNWTVDLYPDQLQVSGEESKAELQKLSALLLQLSHDTSRRGNLELQTTLAWLSFEDATAQLQGLFQRAAVAHSLGCVPYLSLPHWYSRV